MGMQSELGRYVDIKKIHVAYNYISRKDFAKAMDLELLNMNAEYYNVGYVGTLKNGRHPKIILELLKMRIDNKMIMLHFAGTSELQNDYILEKIGKEYHDRVKFYGIVDRMTSLKIMKNMDCLYILINPDYKISDGFGIPGKLFDYIAMKNNLLSDINTFNNLKTELCIKEFIVLGDYVQYRFNDGNYLNDELSRIFTREVIS
jgi:hypothetical protein